MNRRELLGSVGAASLVPAFAAFADVPSPRNDRAFEADFNLGPAQSGAGNQRWAHVIGGEARGQLLCGLVQSGRMEWLVDPASGAVEIAARVKILRADGVLVEVRDRTVHACTNTLAGVSGHTTAPELFDATGRQLTAPALLAGRLDAAEFARGTLKLRAYHQ